VAQRKHDKDKPPERCSAMLGIAHAVMALARAPKSRAVDNACNVYWAQWRDQPRLEVPGYAIDGHTARGRSARTHRTVDLRLELWDLERAAQR
jgi:replication-associated recombination protein RarA